MPLPAKCAEPGILWRSRALDRSSGYTTSTAFDFNCDDALEVVYRDECCLRVYEGKTGKVLFATTATSYTAWEGVAIADTDGSGHAKLVVPMDKGEGFINCPREDQYTKVSFAATTRARDSSTSELAARGGRSPVVVWRGSKGRHGAKPAPAVRNATQATRNATPDRPWRAKDIG